MNNRPATLHIDRDTFLRLHHFTAEEFEKAALDWALLEQICERHIAMSSELRTTADFISERLQSVPEVHSLKIRIKHPHHLIAKLIRKRLTRPEMTLDEVSYEAFVTDLIGLRALHLFKDEWQPIHAFVTQTWELHEKPIAYVREGDSAAILADFGKADFDIQKRVWVQKHSLHHKIATGEESSIGGATGPNTF